MDDFYHPFVSLCLRGKNPTFGPHNPKHMDPVLKKLNYKGQPTVLVLNAPDSFRPVLDNLDPDTMIFTDVEDAAAVSFALIFATRQAEIDHSIAAIAPKLEGDAIIWYAYPKGSSKRYTCEFNRDTGWAALGRHGLEPVRQVAIDEDWSALRFRRVEYIKAMKRDPKRMLSEQGRKKSEE